jgi:hypothetical protein
MDVYTLFTREKDVEDSSIWHALGYRCKRLSLRIRCGKKELIR